MKKIKLLTITILLTFFSQQIFAKSDFGQNSERPKIVVGLVVDQMCWDYLYRYNSSFGEGGFKRLLNEGFNCNNTRINYLPSVTAIGHTTVYTGSVPSIHGIAGNDFYENDKSKYCTGDTSVQTVGGEPGRSGQMSPRNLLTTTIGDELRIACNFRNKVIGIALKDRGAILPAGHTANAAYWFDDKAEGFITSTYYMSELPQWLKKFNKKGLAKKYIHKKWKPSLSKKEYLASTEDATKYEYPWDEKDSVATLPFDPSKYYKKENAKIIRSIPAGNTLTFDLAKACIEGEELGKSTDAEVSDFLAISLSATDYIGHTFGVDAVETQDCYIKLDKDLADFLKYMDSRFGKDNYLFFITADHAGGHNMTYLNDRKIETEPWLVKSLKEDVNAYCKSTYNTDKNLILSLSNYQVHFDHATIDSLGLDRKQVYYTAADFFKKQELTNYAVVAEDVNLHTVPEPIKTMINNGYNAKRSGDVFVILKPGSYSHYRPGHPRGTSHSMWAPYDSHIPLIFMGWNIPAGHLYREVYMTDISATLAFLLHCQLPNGCIGKPITEIFEK